LNSGDSRVCAVSMQVSSRATGESQKLESGINEKLMNKAN